MNLDEFFDYKNRLMYDLLQNDEIVRLINDGVEIQDAKGLAYTYVFPFEYLPDTVEVAKTFICFDVDITKSLAKPLYQPVIYIWVFTHKSKLRLPEGGVRTDKLCSEIAKLLSDNYYYGLGELELTAVKRFAPMSNYQGKVMTFTAVDFSKVANGKRNLPSNRKVY